MDETTIVLSPREAIPLASQSVAEAHRVDLVSEMAEGVMASKHIFISHAVKDRAIADALVDLLTSVGVAKPGDIFCSSVDGMSIPKGKNFIAFIREQIQNPELVILLLSPNYFDSIFCVCELGAAWAMAHEVFPLVVPPLKFEELKAVLTGVQAGVATDASALNDLKDALCASLGSSVSSARWETKRNAFVKRVEEELKQASPPGRVAYKQFAELEAKYIDAMSELAKSEEQITSLEGVIVKLKKTKDADEVSTVLREASGEQEQFEALVDAAKRALGRLPGVVADCLFHETAGTVYSPNEMDNWTWDSIREAIANDFLEDHDGLSTNEGDPKVHAARRAVDEVAGFLSEISDEFHEWYVHEHGHQPKITNRRFWKVQFEV